MRREHGHGRTLQNSHGSFARLPHVPGNRFSACRVVAVPCLEAQGASFDVARFPVLLSACLARTAQEAPRRKPGRMVHANLRHPAAVRLAGLRPLTVDPALRAWRLHKKPPAEAGEDGSREPAASCRSSLGGPPPAHSRPGPPGLAPPQKAPGGSRGEWFTRTCGILPQFAWRASARTQSTRPSGPGAHTKSPRRKPGDSGSHAFPGAMRCGFEPEKLRVVIRRGRRGGFHTRCPRVSTRGFSCACQAWRAGLIPSGRRPAKRTAARRRGFACSMLPGFHPGLLVCVPGLEGRVDSKRAQARQANRGKTPRVRVQHVPGFPPGASRTGDETDSRFKESAKHRLQADSCSGDALPSRSAQHQKTRAEPRECGWPHVKRRGFPQLTLRPSRQLPWRGRSGHATTSLPPVSDTAPSMLAGPATEHRKPRSRGRATAGSSRSGSR